MNIAIGRALRLIREGQNLKSSYVALQAGYLNISTYSRLESGKIKHIDMAKLEKICAVFKCNLVHLFLVAAISESEKDIVLWSDFMKSLPNISQTDKSQLDLISSKLFNPSISPSI